MALIKCSECGREISDKAISCPGCGCPINVNQEKSVVVIQKETKKEIPYLVAAVFAVILIISIVFFVKYLKQYNRSSETKSLYSFGVSTEEFMYGYASSDTKKKYDSVSAKLKESKTIITISSISGIISLVIVIGVLWHNGNVYEANKDKDDEISNSSS